MDSKHRVLGASYRVSDSWLRIELKVYDCTGPSQYWPLLCKSH
jgi:hypothetical protein